MDRIRNVPIYGFLPHTSVIHLGQMFGSPPTSLVNKWLLKPPVCSICIQSDDSNSLCAVSALFITQLESRDILWLVPWSWQWAGECSRLTIPDNEWKMSRSRGTRVIFEISPPDCLTRLTRLTRTITTSNSSKPFLSAWCHKRGFLGTVGHSSFWK